MSNDRWLVSYADFITLLFGFFVVLYAFSKADEKKQVEVTASIDTAFRSLGIFSESARHAAKGAKSSAGAETPAIPMNIVMGEDVLSPARVKDDLEQIRRDLTQTLSNQIASHTVSIKMGRDGLVISLREAGFFSSGSATPRAETLTTLRQVATSLGRTRYDLRIEGHTDNVPIHSAEFDSNWELSSARATRMARLFLELKAIPPERLSAAGYAEFHPVASNDSADGRAENRRVDLIVMPRTKLDLSVPDYPRNGGPWQKITDPDASAAQR
jgi:chemotaxis protein MotB